MDPIFPLMAKVKVKDPTQPCQEGYVIEFREQNGQRLYKLSLDDKDGTWENWYAEDALERC